MDIALSGLPDIPIPSFSAYDDPSEFAYGAATSNLAGVLPSDVESFAVSLL